VRSTCLQLKWSLQMSSSKSAMSFEKNRGAGLVTAHHHLPREGCQKRKEKDGWLRQGHPKSTKSICLKYFMNFYWFIQQKFGENHGRSHHPSSPSWFRTSLPGAALSPSCFLAPMKGRSDWYKLL
jgi:hypothetical protein